MHSVADEIPLRFRDKKLTDYEPSTASQVEAFRAAMDVAHGDKRNLVLVGPPGVGKTHLSAGIILSRSVNERVAWETAAAATPEGGRIPTRPDRPEWVNVADLIVRLRAEMSGPLDDRTGQATVWRVSRSKGIAVLDDLGRERQSDWTGEIVYALVNARYEAKLPTIVTSNLTPKELAASPYWPAISRLAEDGALVRIEAPDHRLRKSA